MKKNKIAILFGGVSPEHEVSIITGLQVVEKVDRSLFEVFPIFQDQEGIFWYYPNLTRRQEFKKTKPKLVIFGKDSKGGFFKTESLYSKKYYLDAVYLAYHGGNGESGAVQGMLQNIEVAFTSSSVEASAIAMNKVLTKEVLEKNGIDTIPWVRLFGFDIKENVDASAKVVTKHLSLPVIIKPVHLGSSIGVAIAKTEVELKKKLLEASHVDSEVLIEQFIEDFKEYNCSVRLIDELVQSSEVEEPLAQDEILSFADKYQRGSGKKGSGGMASLVRQLPADISKELENKIQETAKRVFTAIRAKGMVRIDFMATKSKLYVVEVNPIPGSMAYYLWEATGISFRDQITDLVNQSIKDKQELASKRLSYHTDIVEKFVNNTDR